MNSLLFSFQRTIRSASFLLMLLVLVTVIPLFAGSAETISPAPAGFVGARIKDASAQKIEAYLLENGFVECADEEELYAEISAGNLECGVIIPDELEKRLRAADLDNLLLFIDSPTALLSDLWREYAAAAVYSVYAPYITADVLSDSEIELEEVLAAYDDMMSSGYAFTFEIETISGAMEPAQVRTTQFVLFACAVLIFIAVGFGVCIPVVSDSKIMGSRIGARRTIQNLYLPQLVIRNLLVWLAGAAGVWLAGFQSFIPMLAVYIILINCTGLVLLSLFDGKSWLQIFTTLICLASVVLCPLFIDISLFFPVFGFLRKLCPTYWLWMLADNIKSGLFFAMLAIGLTTAVQALNLVKRRVRL
jgi:hypothetical protein